MSTPPSASEPSVHFSSARHDWGTPQAFFDKVNDEFHLHLDVCATDDNAKLPRYFTIEDDGLSTPWVIGDQLKVPARCWMNPPYGREIGKWMKKAYEESTRGAFVVCLVPARTDTKWWHDYAVKGEIRFLRGRLKFDGHANSAPFPSALVIFRPYEIWTNGRDLLAEPISASTIASQASELVRLSGASEAASGVLLDKLRGFADDLEYAVAQHKEANADWLRDDGKRSVTIVDYQLSKNDLGAEARLLRETVAELVRLRGLESRVRHNMRRYTRGDQLVMACEIFGALDPTPEEEATWRAILSEPPREIHRCLLCGRPHVNCCADPKNCPADSGEAGRK